MIAMELNGSHVGKTAKFTWPKKTIKRKIAIVHHHPGGRVSVKPSVVGWRNSHWEYIPFDAEVEFV